MVLDFIEMTRIDPMPMTYSVHYHTFKSPFSPFEIPIRDPWNPQNVPIKYPLDTHEIAIISLQISCFIAIRLFSLLYLPGMEEQAATAWYGQRNSELVVGQFIGKNGSGKNSVEVYSWGSHSCKIGVYSSLAAACSLFWSAMNGIVQWFQCFMMTDFDLPSQLPSQIWQPRIHQICLCRWFSQL